MEEHRVGEEDRKCWELGYYLNRASGEAFTGAGRRWGESTRCRRPGKNTPGAGAGRAAEASPRGQWAWGRAAREDRAALTGALRRPGGCVWGSEARPWLLVSVWTLLKVTGLSSIPGAEKEVIPLTSQAASPSGGREKRGDCITIPRPNSGIRGSC